MTTASAAELESLFEVDRVTLRVWAKRGHITKVGRDRYDVDSVLARIANPPQPSIRERAAQTLAPANQLRDAPVHQPPIREARP